MVKQVEGLEDRIGPVDCALFASRTVPNVAGHLLFPDVKLSVHLPDSWRCIETCKVLGLQPLLDNCGLDVPFVRNTYIGLLVVDALSLLESISRSLKHQSALVQA